MIFPALLEEGGKQMSINKYGIRSGEKCYKGPEKRQWGEGVEPFPEEWADGSVPERLVPFQQETERCLEDNKPGE